RRGRTTAELSARKIIPAQCRTSPAPSETPDAAQDAHVPQREAAPAHRENARPQNTLAPRHRIAPSGAQDIRTFGGARRPADHPATRAGTNFPIGANIRLSKI